MQDFFVSRYGQNVRLQVWLPEFEYPSWEDAVKAAIAEYGENFLHQVEQLYAEAGDRGHEIALVLLVGKKDGGWKDYRPYENNIDATYNFICEVMSASDC